MFTRICIVLSLIFLTVSCAIVPDDIEVADEKALVSYKGAATRGAEAAGSMARWGGIIVNVENKPQKTLVEVAHFPLVSYGKPNTSDSTVGRFKAQLDGFVDPIVFEEGRTVTFVGELGEPVAGMVGEQPYTYPLIKATGYHLWRETSTYDISPMYFHYGMGWYSPFYYRYAPFNSWQFGPAWGFPGSRIRVIESRDPNRRRVDGSPLKPSAVAPTRKIRSEKRTRAVPVRGGEQREER